MRSDWDYLEQARSGDENAWRYLVEHHSPQLVKMAFLITGSMETAKDIVQDSFVRLFRRREKHRIGNFKAYLSTIAYHLSLKEKQKGLRNQNIENLELSDHNPGPMESVLKKERDRQLVEIIGSLDSHHRDILVLRFYGNHSYEEMAQITDLPIGTVKSRIFYAVKACRDGLRKKGIIE
jgi:RNA polymerase sigma-70 factor (ECF subfamily)